MMAVQCANPEKSSPSGKNPNTSISENPQCLINDTSDHKATTSVLLSENQENKNPEHQLLKTSDYALYVPTNCPSKKYLPIVFIFDPHAKGNLPVDMYKSLADEFGFVLAGSNKSQNNQVIEDGFQFYKEMKADVAKNVTINTDQIYVMGFSGGARVAVSIAIQQPEINAAIGCGAGFPAVRHLPQSGFYYFSFAGYEDFNLGELMNNHRALSREGFRNELAIFDGGHDWPPVEIMREAFFAIQINNIRQNIVQEDQQIIKKTSDYYAARISHFVDNNRYFDAAETALRAKSVLTDVAPIDEFARQTQTFQKNTGYSHDLRAMVHSMETENGRHNEFLEAFTHEDLHWWKSEIEQLKTPVEDIFQERQKKRLTAWLGLMSYMMVNRALAQNDPAQAQKNIDIYRTVEPENPEHAYLNARVMMQTGDEAKAFEYLEQAVALGFNDKQRFLNEPAFKYLNNKNTILKTMY